MPLYPSVVIGAALIALAAIASSPDTAAAQAGSQGATKSTDSSSEPLPVSLDRIREGVMRDSRITLPDFGVPTFRISVEQETIKLPGEFDKRNAVGDEVRGYYFSNAHQEFLNMSSPTGYPVQAPGGIPVLSLISALKKGFRDREAARIRGQVLDELEQIDPEAARGRRALPPPRR